MARTIAPIPAAGNLNGARKSWIVEHASRRTGKLGSVLRQRLKPGTHILKF